MPDIPWSILGQNLLDALPLLCLFLSVLLLFLAMGLANHAKQSCRTCSFVFLAGIVVCAVIAAPVFSVGITVDQGIAVVMAVAGFGTIVAFRQLLARHDREPFACWISLPGLFFMLNGLHLLI